VDERATELDKQRTSTISSISYINERNRKKNVEEAEKAIMEESRERKGQKTEDPFTRRNTKPSRPSVLKLQIADLKLDTEDLKPDITDAQPDDPSQSSAGNGRTDEAPIELIAPIEDQTDSKPPISNKILSTGDLFSAHDFDIKLDLEARLPDNSPVQARGAMLQPPREPAPKRSLNLEDYKRKRGLI